MPAPLGPMTRDDRARRPPAARRRARLDLAVGHRQRVDLECRCGRACSAAALVACIPLRWLTRLPGRLRARPGCAGSPPARPRRACSPNSITTSRSARPITNSMSCSTSRIVMPSPCSVRRSCGQRLLLEEAQSRRRLVEQQQRRIGRERAGDLDDPLLAERQAARLVEHVLGQADALDLARGDRRECAPPRRGRGAMPRAPRPRSPRRYAPSATLSSTVICGSSLTCWNVRPMPAARSRRAARRSDRRCRGTRSRPT